MHQKVHTGVTIYSSAKNSKVGGSLVKYVARHMDYPDI